MPTATPAVAYAPTATEPTAYQRLAASRRLCCEPTRRSCASAFSRLITNARACIAGGMKSIDLRGTYKVLTATVVSEGIIAVCAIALTIGAMARLIPIIRDQLVAPFDLISEGPHLQLMIAVRDGFNIYAPESHLDSPF